MQVSEWRSDKGLAIVERENMRSQITLNCPYKTLHRDIEAVPVSGTLLIKAGIWITGIEKIRMHGARVQQSM